MTRRQLRTSGSRPAPSTAALLAAAALCAAVAPDASAQSTPPPATTDASTPPPVKRPGFQQLRFQEDWSVLRGQPREGLDAFKYIPLNDDEDIYLSFGGQYRLRLESWNNFGFNGDNDDTFLLSRLRLHGDLHVGEHFRAFLELKSALATDRDLPGGKRTIDVDSIDIQNAFIDLRLPLDDDIALTLRPGRQELLFGKQRLVSPLDWVNTRRTFEGVSAILELPDWRVSGFWTQPVRVRKYDSNKPDRDTEFFGVYAEGKVGKLGLDLYWLGLDAERTTIAGATGSDHRQTFGARLGGNIGDSGFDFDVESAVQVGRHAGRDVLAFMMGSEVGYRFKDAPWSPRLALGFDYASGDDDPADDNARTFNQLFPLGHAYLGSIDAVGRQNILAVKLGLSVKPHDTLLITLDGHAFWLADSDDALYNAAGGVLRAPVPGASREVGQEIDLRLTWTPARGWSAIIGYSHFFAGDFISDTGPSKDIDFAYASVQFTF